MGLRERKKQQTRDALSLATIGLVAERGWGNVTIEDIAVEADVSVRTFRNYFANKAEAIAARHLDRMRRVATEVRQAPAGEPLWQGLTTAVLRQFESEPGTGAQQLPDPQHADGVRLMISEPELHGEVLKASAAADAELAAAIAERTGADLTREIYPKLAAAALGAAVATAIEHSLRADSPVPLGTALREALDTLATGLSTTDRK